MTHPHPLRRPDQPFGGRQFTGGTKGAHTGWKYGGGSGPSQNSLSTFPPSLTGTLPRPGMVLQYVWQTLLFHTTCVAGDPVTVGNGCPGHH
jgi:hypothetical protein